MAASPLPPTDQLRLTPDSPYYMEARIPCGNEQFRGRSIAWPSTIQKPWHLDQFSRFSTAHGYVQQTDTQRQWNVTQ